MNSLSSFIAPRINRTTVVMTALALELCFFLLMYTHVIQLSTRAFIAFGIVLALTLLVLFVIQVVPRLAELDPRRYSVRLSKMDIAFLIGIVALAAFFRFRILDLPITVDEAHTVVDFADPQSSSLADTFTEYGLNNNHPLNSLAIRLTVSLVGDSSPPYIRLPAFFVGLILVICVYFVGRRAFESAYVGAFAALYVALLPALIQYSALARGYILITLSFLILVLAAWELYRKPSFPKWFLLGLFSVIGMYSNIAMIYGLIVVFVWLLIVLLRTRRFRDTGIMMGVGLVTVTTVILFYMPMFIRQGITVFYNSLTESIPLGQFLSDLKSITTSVLYPFYFGFPNIISVIVIGILGIFVVLASVWEIRHLKRLPILFVLVIMIPLTLIIQRPASVFARIYIFYAPVVVLYVALGVQCLLRQHKIALYFAPVLFTIFMLLASNLKNPLDYREDRLVDGDQALTYLIENESLSQDDSVIGYSGENWEILYYLWQHHAPPQISLVVRDPTSSRRIFLILAPRRTPDDLITLHLGKIKDSILAVNPVTRLDVNTIYEVIRR